MSCHPPKSSIGLNLSAPCATTCCTSLIYQNEGTSVSFLEYRTSIGILKVPGAVSSCLDLRTCGHRTKGQPAVGQDVTVVIYTEKASECENEFNYLAVSLANGGRNIFWSSFHKFFFERFSTSVVRQVFLGRF